MAGEPHGDLLEQGEGAGTMERAIWNLRHRPGGARRGRGARWVAAALFMAGCTLDDVLGTRELPRGVTDPKITETAEGALTAHNGVVAALAEAFGIGLGNVVVVSGMMTDELEAGTERMSTLDRRDVPDGSEQLFASIVYSALQRVRGQAAQAIGLLNRYAPDSGALVGHVLALQGYAEIFLADLFCSGIPLSTLDFEGDFTYRPGSTTEEVYAHAAILFDSALALTGDSVRFAHLARIGKARALLALGRTGEAAAIVKEVPDGYSYALRYSATNDGWRNFAVVDSSRSSTQLEWTVADHEGINGLDYVSSGDPRTAVAATWGMSARGKPLRHPRKYATDGGTPIVLASGIEARLIEAEAALEAGDVAAWLQGLNQLRQTAWPTIEPAVSQPLPELTDPGDHDARVDLLFRERAFWLFLTGHRQGDLRRLIRHYGRLENEIYPIGAYDDPERPGLSYGSDVDVPVPDAERISNPYYSGCISRGA